MSSDAETTGPMSPDLVFDILSNTRRRMVLYYLRQHGGSASVKELAEQIAALENEVDTEDLGRQQRKRVYVSLYQTHIPKLRDAGIIEYDDSEGTVWLTNRATEFDSYLTTTESNEPWRRYYLALALAGGVLLFSSSIGVPILAAIPIAGLGVGLALGFSALAGFQYWKQKQREKEIPAELLRHD